MVKQTTQQILVNEYKKLHEVAGHLCIVKQFFEIKTIYKTIHCILQTYKLQFFLKLLQNSVDIV